jgi:hypothetical protein
MLHKGHAAILPSVCRCFTFVGAANEWHETRSSALWVVVQKAAYVDLIDGRLMQQPSSVLQGLVKLLSEPGA